MEEVAPGVTRVTIRIPLGVREVHCYALVDGPGFILVDTGVAVDHPSAHWGPVLARLGGPVERIVITHDHLDHAGGAGDVQALTGAAVLQAEVDLAAPWRTGDGDDVLREHLASHGVPDDLIGEMLAELSGLRTLRRSATGVKPLPAGVLVGEWESVSLPGHAGSQIGLLRGDVLIAGDAILDPITPTIDCYRGSRPDPLGEHFDSLALIAGLGLRLALGGHGRPIRDPRARAVEIAHHHARRLVETRAALGSGETSAFDVALRVFPQELPPTHRRLAVVETIAHLAHLVGRDEVAQTESSGGVLYRVAA